MRRLYIFVNCISEVIPSHGGAGGGFFLKNTAELFANHREITYLRRKIM